MNKTTIVFLLGLLFANTISAQNPEDVVRIYIHALNEWLASPYDYNQRQNVIKLLTGPNGDCTMLDSIVAKYGEGKNICHRDAYLSILSTLTKKRTIRVQIVSIKDVEYRSDRDIVTATLQYSGEISMTTDTEFWVFNNNSIGFIDKGRSKQKETEIVEVEKIIEKEKIIQVESSDKNTGKAYLILKISEPNADIKVDYTTYKANDKEFVINLTYGHHYVSVSKPTFGTVSFSVNLTGEPIERHITLKSATVEMKVDKEYDANLFVDGVNYGKSNNSISVSADQRHTIRIEKKRTYKIQDSKGLSKGFYSGNAAIF